jgi:MinD-like ATPase involved in chromosome partitioning or flagellar assembly
MREKLLKILVANRKGGCGKTTIATQLAAALAAYGDTCYLADTDRQRSSLGWLANRPSNAPVITALDWTRKIGKTPEGNGFLVIDTAAGLRGKHAVEMVALADLLLLPRFHRPSMKTRHVAFLVASVKAAGLQPVGHVLASWEIGCEAVHLVPSGLSRDSASRSSHGCAIANFMSNAR